MLRFLVLLTICSTLGMEVWRMMFDNFAVRTVGLEGIHVGIAQSVREIPGFLSLLVVYVMLIMSEHRIAALSILVFGAGLAAVGFFPSFAGILFTTVVVSFGFHYFETAYQSLILQYFDHQTAPIVFGKLRSMAAAASIAAGAFVFLLSSVWSLLAIYFAVGALLAAAGIWSLFIDPSHKDIVPQHKRMVIRKRYWLYYLLTFLSGARRQIFVAFALFLLVKKFDFSVQSIALLFLVNNTINYFLNPLLGWAIVRFGERKIMTIEYSSMLVVFLGYALVQSKWVAMGLYIADQLFFNFSVAIRTFFQKIADPRDIAPGTAVGFTINHIAAVILPLVGGILWMIDYRIPFVGGAVLSVISLGAVQFVDDQLRKGRSLEPDPDYSAGFTDTTIGPG